MVDSFKGSNQSIYRNIKLAALVVALIAVFIAGRPPRQADNFVSNGRFDVWIADTSAYHAKNGNVIADGWGYNCDNDPSFTVSRNEPYARIVINNDNNAKMIDFYQPMKEIHRFKGKKLFFSARIRCSKPYLCRVIMNSDQGTSGSVFNSSTDWEVLQGNITIGQDALSFLNFAVRIDNISGPAEISIADCIVQLEPIHDPHTYNKT